MLRASAAERNAVPIANVLAMYLLRDMKLLEISSGTGQHVINFAEKFPSVTFQPSEIDARSLHSIVAYIDHYRLGNVRVPLFIDVTKPVNHWALPADYGPLAVDVILNINMIHISSDAAVEGLFRASNILLKRGTGLLITYGPYAIDGVISPQSNIDFDNSLRSRNPEWGLRDVRDLNELAMQCGMRLVARHDMPANNHMLIFSRD
ncbi:Methyltransferase like 26 [Trichostrongylus colubriformis]|uniref:Methyltransferase like 26 n=1 Tax=Trichostrongylus colubriformis TaxID=6319 RepID=A0AAN8FTB3_TRICO